MRATCLGLVEFRFPVLSVSCRPFVVFSPFQTMQRICGVDFVHVSASVGKCYGGSVVFSGFPVGRCVFSVFDCVSCWSFIC